MSYDPPVVTPATAILADGSVPMAADLDMDGNGINNVVDPLTDQQAATKKYVDDAIVLGGGYTDEQAQDAVGTILTDTATVNATYTDATPEIKFDVIPGGIKLDDFAAPDDNADLNVSSSAHGLMPKATGSTTTFYRSDGTQATPAGGSGDSTRTGADASIPAASNDGDLYLPNDGFRVYRDTGAAYATWGPLFPLTAPVDGDFAWINQGSASVSTTNGGIYLLAPALAGGNWKIRKKAVPAAPYTLTIGFLPVMVGVSSPAAGIVLRQSSDGKLVLLYFALTSATVSQIKADKWSSPTVGVANYITTGIVTVAPMVWLRVNDDNTNRKFSFSSDGVNFIQVHSVGRTDYLTPDEIGFGVSSENATYAAGMTLLSWKQE